MKHGMAHRTVPGHFSEGHFRQQPGFEPVHVPGLRTAGWIDHRRLFHLQGLELIMEAAQGRLVEPGADFAGITQLAVIVIMQSQQQRPEGMARAFRLGETDDDEFLSMLAFELDPIAAAPGYIGRPLAFADQPFHVHLAGAVEQGAGLLAKRLGETQQRLLTGIEHRRQRSSTLFDRHLAQVHAIEVRQVEQVVENVVAAIRFEGVLQRLKVRKPLLVHHHHFTVEPRRFQAQRGQGHGLPWQFVGPIVTIASDQLHLAVVDAGHDPVAVELDFVAPWSVGDFFHQRRQLRL
ncbi:hypothetical protein D3C85_956730 [compost metagenome]